MSFWDDKINSDSFDKETYQALIKNAKNTENVFQKLDQNSQEKIKETKWRNSVLKAIFGKKDPYYDQTEFDSCMHREANICTVMFVILSFLAMAILGGLVYGYLHTGIKIEEAKELYKFIPYIPITIACYISFAVLCRYAFVYSRLSLQYRHKARLMEMTRFPNISQNIKDSMYKEVISIDITDPKKYNDLNDIVDVMIKLKELNK